MRPTIIAGNWKMNLNMADAKQLASGLKEKLPNNKDREVWIFPSHLHVPSVSQVVEGSRIRVGIQNFEIAYYT